jgi:hypothetical protein
MIELPMLEMHKRHPYKRHFQVGSRGIGRPR